MPQTHRGELGGEGIHVVALPIPHQGPLLLRGRANATWRNTSFIVFFYVQ